MTTAFPHFEFETISAEQIRVESVETISIGPLVRFIEEQGTQVTEARRIRPSLEDVFVRVTGVELDIMRKEKEKDRGSL
jgi:ABC-2 type transport system ATP-binding protein